MNPICPVCGTHPANVSPWGPLIRVQCPRCGDFALAQSVYDDLPELFQRNSVRPALMSHTIRRMQRHGRQVTIHPTTVDTYWSRGRLPSPKEQVDELVLWIGDNQPDNTTPAKTDERALDAWIGAPLTNTAGLAGGLRWLLRAMLHEGKTPLLNHALGAQVELELTLSGWEKYADLKQTRNDSRTAFMAMKFGDAELNRVVEECFRPAVAQAGFELRLVTDNQPAGLIDDQMKAAILASRLVIADLTHGSAGAYWEAGFGEGLGLPVIYSCEKSAWERQKTHFDTNHYKTILWDTSNLRNAGDDLTATIRATLPTEAKLTDD